MSTASIIAIDGPAASGKSTLAQLLAEVLGYLFFDTGVMYRAVTWAALEAGISLDDETAVTNLANQIKIDVRPPSVDDGRVYDVLVDDRDITWQIRSSEVDANVSQVSAYAGVRASLSAQQRRIGLRGQVVMVGRDIGTVVLPEADLKIFLDASVEERARRRYQENQLRGGGLSQADILAAMRRRDEIDSTRDVAPLKAADDAILIDSDQLSIAQVLDSMLQLVHAQSDSTADR